MGVVDCAKGTNALKNEDAGVSPGEGLTATEIASCFPVGFVKRAINSASARTFSMVCCPLDSKPAV